MVASCVDPLQGLGPLDHYLDAAIEAAQRNEIIVYAIYLPAEGHSSHSFFRTNRDTGSTCHRPSRNSGCPATSEVVVLIVLGHPKVWAESHGRNPAQAHWLR
jgi:hypothetical protein